MKNVAFYLPQYHSFPENDAWWGKGFTEWTNVKKSSPQFKNHYQPEVPFEKNYYNLLDGNFQVAQSDMALSYGIDAFCYYHYWFSGKLLLEKPLENMLHNKNIKMPYMMCWANESWTRSWDGKTNSILIEQNNDEDEAAWKNHFEYLLQFFKDERYEKMDNKPVFLIYKPQLIHSCDKMMIYWNELAVENGFSGIYWGWQHPSAEASSIKDQFDFGVNFEPLYTVQKMKEKYLDNIGHELAYGLHHPAWLRNKIAYKCFKKPLIHNYDDIWADILNRESNQKMMPGAFPAWDNTPRRGNQSTIFWEADPEKFKRYYGQLVEKYKNKSMYLFINAWNEWGEGAHLEPDEKFGFGYLDVIKEYHH